MRKTSTHSARPAASLWGVLALAAALSACQKSADEAPKKPGGGAPEVGVVTVGTADAPFELALPGRLSASQVAEIRPQVSGVVTRRLFTEGALVKAGQALYQLDDAALAAERARTAAALQKAEAQLAVAKTKAARDAELLKADAVSRQQADDTAAALLQAQADVAVARAALDAAQVQLTRARIASPIGGRVDISTVTAGALVTANQTQALTTVQQLDPMQVDIVQSSTEMLTLRRQLEGKNGSRQVKLVLEDGTAYPLAGQLTVNGVSVDRGTGAVTLRATVPNPQGLLLPGMVVTAKLVAGVDAGAILVPQQGVSRSATGEATALVVGEGNKAERRRLKLERAVGNQWLVTDGLKVGDKLIVEGLQRARPNQPVTPVPAGSAPKKKGDKAASAGGTAAPGAKASSPSSASAPKAG